jgi:hypothetical protein
MIQLLKSPRPPPTCILRYTGLIVGMKGDNPHPDVVAVIMAKVPDIVIFITEIFRDRNLTDDNIRNSLGLVGDLVDIFGADMCSVRDACAQLSVLTSISHVATMPTMPTILTTTTTTTTTYTTYTYTITA